MKNIVMRKAVGTVLLSLAFVASLFFTACTDPMSSGPTEGNGLVTITIAGKNVRAVVSWADTLDSDRLVHTITFSGGEGGPHTKTIPPGGGTAYFSVIPGRWTIKVEAHLSGELIAVGNETRQINPGNNGAVVVQMKEPAGFPRYSVNFNSNGGSTVTSQTVKKYSKASRPETPTKDGMGFVDWFKDNTTFNNEYDFDDAVTEAMTLYAKWSDISFFVTFFDVDNVTELDKQKVGEKGHASHPENVTNPGHTAEWYTDSDRTASALWDFEHNTVTADTSLYLKWAANTYRITIDLNGGNDGPLLIEVTYGQPVPDTVLPARPGYTFNGFFDAPTGGTKYYNDDATSARVWDKAEDGILYAQWTEATQTFTDIPTFKAWLDAQPNGTYNVKLNVSDLTGIGSALTANSTKYVNLDLSGSTFSIVNKRTFYGCTNLIGVTIPDGIMDIEEGYSDGGAFENCTGLTSVTINVQRIGDKAFANCTGLTSVIIKSSVWSIGHSSFVGCTSLTSVKFEGTITSGEFWNNTGDTVPGDLRAKYLAGGPGTYTRQANSTEWTRIGD